MKALFSMISLGLVLAAVPASAALTRYGDIRKPCPSGGCVDAWKVQCSSNKTEWMQVRVRDLVDGDYNFFSVNAIGIGGSQAVLGVAEWQEHNPSESFVFSPPAIVSQPYALGPVTGLVMVSLMQSDTWSTTPVKSYVVEFQCRGFAEGEETGQPTVTLLQDQ